MKRTTAAASLLFVFLTIAGQVSAQDGRVVLEVGGLRNAGPPRLLGDQILYSYQFSGPARDGQVHSVAAAFEHQNFSELHVFDVNEYGIYVLLLPHSRNVDIYRYRIVVDGVWGPDPLAPRQSEDRWGVSLSEFVPRARAVAEYPAVLSDGYVEFRLETRAGQSVALVGTFNGWDPFMTPMTETEPGLYSRTVRLTKGEHLYYYMVDGRRLADPRNANTRWNVDGMVVSSINLP